MDNSLMNSPIKLLIFSLWIILFSVSYHFTNNLINDIYEIIENENIYEINENISNNKKYYNMMNSERTKKIIKSMNTEVCNYNDDNWYNTLQKCTNEYCDYHNIKRLSDSVFVRQQNNHVTMPGYKSLAHQLVANRWNFLSRK